MAAYAWSVALGSIDADCPKADLDKMLCCAIERINLAFSTGYVFQPKELLHIHSCSTKYNLKHHKTRLRQSETTIRSEICMVTQLTSAGMAQAVELSALFAYGATSRKVLNICT